MSGPLGGPAGRVGAVMLLALALPALFAAGCSVISEGVQGDGLGGDDAVAAIPPPVAGQAQDERRQAESELAVVVRPTVEIPTEWGSEIEELYGRYWLYWDAFAAAHGPPNADPGYGPLKELSTEQNWETLAPQLRSFADDGLLLALPERSITEHLLRIPNASVLSRDEGSEVVLQDCWIDDFVQRTVTGQIVSEAKEAKLMNVTMKVIDGTWRVDGITKAATDSDGYHQCAALITP